MSKVAKAREEQGFQMRPTHPKCADCQHFTMDVEKIPDYWRPSRFLEKEKNLRCGIGGFKVGKTSVCLKFKHKVMA